MKHLLFLIFAVQACLPGFAACDGRVRIVPRPAEVEELPGSFRLTPRTPVVITDERLRTPAEIFARAVGKLTGTEPAVTAVPEKHAVTLQLQPGYEAEEYLLEVGRQRITVTASTPQAVLHGFEASSSWSPEERFPPASSATSPRSPTAGRCSTSAAISSRSRT